ncbi:methionyl-tRNA formyltransferase [Leeuwenhoekiella marinoflava]|uniref:Methionyl-tRNA formyltransferase n=2 Tax=Leeuwenhoekiella marinoflava TaxID=988 RepID=A0A4Q0PKK8_9FLAO|nr:methionyl-tRNA formyltransferase [Leeuwenhoekiella marinoflava]RXG28474.1 methionyl-tRNA formyltransferase [Leeuwenhoekiella marinoflava]SHF52660.1 methionyl-tRNA formyltransferase [Leeuwenhoekiella marinoflava DSM 3653]
MRDLRIVFMGTPDFAVAGLQKLVENKYTVVGVITAPDRPAGRGQKIQQSAVKQYAVKANLKVLQPTNLKDPEFIDELKTLNANLQIVVAFRMLPEVVWKMPEYGTFNLHASLLPDYRGAAPINWAIITGEKETGVTTFFIDEKIDTGAIILQEKIKIETEENAGSLHDRLMNLGSELILKTVQLIEKGTVETTIQPKQEQLHTAYKLNRDNTRIDWSQPVESIYNHIRGLSPYPVAWTLFTNGDEKELQLKVYKASITSADESSELGEASVGEISIKNDELFVATSSNWLKLEEVQLSGKKRMPVKDLLNGFSFQESAKTL